VQLQKVSGVGASAGKTVHKQTSSAKAPLPAGSEPAAKALSTFPRSVPALLAAAGLPADKLSASIVSFARFFSLPLKPELLSVIRRQVLTTTQQDSNKPFPVESKSGSSVSSEIVSKIREAVSLAACAAASKGVQLTAEGLESYAASIDPERQKRQQRRNQRERGDNREEPRPSKVQTEDTEKNSHALTSYLRETALESAEKDPLLEILNKLPGKNGQRWIVLPFEFNNNNRNFQVSLRILLENENCMFNTGYMNSRMVLDISEIGKTKQLFLLKARGGTIHSLDVFVYPSYSSKNVKSYTRELSKLMEIPAENITVGNLAGFFPFETECPETLLQTINEAV
jgi:hypothetical protein